MTTSIFIFFICIYLCHLSLVASRRGRPEEAAGRGGRGGGAEQGHKRERRQRGGNIYAEVLNGPKGRGMHNTIPQLHQLPGEPLAPVQQEQEQQQQQVNGNSGQSKRNVAPEDFVEDLKGDEVKGTTCMKLLDSIASPVEVFSRK